MDLLSRVVLAVAGGGLLVYGFTRAGATKKSDPLNSSPILSQLEVPDAPARTDGKLALFIGSMFVLSALFG
jgi:hypothetical protein